jgi:selenide,water dikinase
MTLAVTWMTTLNDAASRAMLAAGAHAATDVTGFGLLGHAREMANASNVRALIAAGVVPGGTLDNLAADGRVTEGAGIAVE